MRTVIYIVLFILGMLSLAFAMAKLEKYRHDDYNDDIQKEVDKLKEEVARLGKEVGELKRRIGTDS